MGRLRLRLMKARGREGMSSSPVRLVDLLEERVVDQVRLKARPGIEHLVANDADPSMEQSRVRKIRRRRSFPALNILPPKGDETTEARDKPQR